MDRAQKAGTRLALLLAAGAHGDRPVTLIGHSFGARLIFHCLLELSRCRALGEPHIGFLRGGLTTLAACDKRGKRLQIISLRLVMPPLRLALDSFRVQLLRCAHLGACRYPQVQLPLVLSTAAAAGIVEHAVLLGLPVGTLGPRWAMARQAVAGRLINGYTKKVRLSKQGSGGRRQQPLRCCCACWLPGSSLRRTLGRGPQLSAALWACNAGKCTSAHC